MSHVLGADGGNTKTIALIARLDGTIVAWARGGCGDIYSVTPPDSPLREIERTVRSVLETAGIEADALDAACFSMAGADWPEDFALLEGTMRRHGFGRSIAVVNDAMGALRAGSPDGNGVVIVCGTGTGIGAKSAEGRVWHSSFWQEQYGGLAMGQAALRAVYRAELGLDPPTRLRDGVLRAFDQPDVERVLHQFTARKTVRPSIVEIARLSRLLLDEAATGDAVARSIVERFGVSLGDYALAAARQVGLGHAPFTLALSGGIFRHDHALLVETIAARVKTALPHVTPVRSRFEPAVGALLLALEQAGVAVDDAVRDRVAASLPPHEVFET